MGPDWRTAPSGRYSRRTRRESPVAHLARETARPGAYGPRTEEPTLAELHVELVAADRKVWSGSARIVIARTTEGDIGIEPGHIPVLAVLQSGPVTIRTTDG